MKDFFPRLRGMTYSLWYKFFRSNISIGSGLMIYKKLRISGKGSVAIGRNCIVDGIKGDMSQYVSIDTLCPTAVVRIGDNSRLYAARVSSRFQITIGQDALIEESGIIDTDFHSMDRNRELPTDENFDKCKVTIGNRVAIGTRSFITKGVSIGDDVIVAPGSIVATSVKSGLLVCGNPARSQ